LNNDAAAIVVCMGAPVACDNGDVVERIMRQMKATSYLTAVLDQEGPAQTS
jgi:hypothetical protein